MKYPVEEAHAAAQAAAGVARQLGAAADSLQQELAAARERGAGLAADKRALEQQAAADAAASSQLQGQIAELRAAVAQHVESHVALKAQLQALSLDAAQLAASLRSELEETRSSNATLRQQNEQLQARGRGRQRCWPAGCGLRAECAAGGAAGAAA